MGLLWGLVTGHWELGLGVGLFFELLWLDLFHAGTYIPPNGPASTLAGLCLAEIWVLRSPPGVLLPLLISLPLGHLAARLEYFHRRWQNNAYNGLLQWARRSKSEQGHEDRQLQVLIVRSLLQNLVLSFLFFAFVVSLLWLALSLAQAPRSFADVQAHVGWPQLWFCAALGGVLSLRVKRAYVTLGAGVLLAAVLGAALGW